MQNENKFFLIFSIFWSIFILGLSIFLLVKTDQTKFAIGLLVSLPVSIFAGGYCQTKANNEKIAKLKQELSNLDPSVESQSNE